MVSSTSLESLQMIALNLQGIPNSVRISPAVFNSEFLLLSIATVPFVNKSFSMIILAVNSKNFLLSLNSKNPSVPSLFLSNLISLYSILESGNCMEASKLNQFLLKTVLKKFPRILVDLKLVSKDLIIHLLSLDSLAFE